MTHETVVILIRRPGSGKACAGHGPTAGKKGIPRTRRSVRRQVFRTHQKGVRKRDELGIPELIARPTKFLDQLGAPDPVLIGFSMAVLTSRWPRPGRQRQRSAHTARFLRTRSDSTAGRRSRSRSTTRRMILWSALRRSLRSRLPRGRGGVPAEVCVYGHGGPVRRLGIERPRPAVERAFP